MSLKRLKPTARAGAGAPPRGCQPLRARIGIEAFNPLPLHRYFVNSQKNDNQTEKVLERSLMEVGSLVAEMTLNLETALGIILFKMLEI
ncbi:hypothetical protein RUM44_002702 [Polyplax serrata]|uniref:Uncharacterized protein n=1 Tax=Polyplax serrata TaxID=468196 RepID=A0ABR1AFH5_POLSC